MYGGYHRKERLANVVCEWDPAWVRYQNVQREQLNEGSQSNDIRILNEKRRIAKRKNRQKRDFRTPNYQSAFTFFLKSRLPVTMRNQARYQRARMQST